ncbi:retinol dehydrogenase 12-like isoform X1 [Asterias amurensis]|uniref:retinol dehydrogenase 12-like isoform X1 n=1 Tax=Asterias amurensis TaxID=7602 RepID=UPI003AB72181
MDASIPIMANAIMLVFSIFCIYTLSLTGDRRYYTSSVDLHGKTVIVTGGDTGIGRETTLDLAQRGARVILACRNLQKAEDVAKDITSSTGNSEVVVRHLDLSSLQSVREFAQEINEQEKRLDILINNEALVPPTEGSATVDNFDLAFGTNHFGHFLLTNLLLDLLKKSAPSRVVIVSSYIHRVAHGINMTRGDPDGGKDTILYPYLKGYSKSKLANILFSSELARRLESTGVVAVSLHPGVVYSPGLLYLPQRLIFLDDKAAAQTTLHCALDESVVNLSGSYFDNSEVVEPSLRAQDPELAKALWDASCEATKLNC